MCDLLVTNASLVVPTKGIFPDTNILIENGKIKKLIKSIGNIKASKKINANGKYVLPGLIDPHVHYGVYSPIEKGSGYRVEVSLDWGCDHNYTHDET